MHHLLARGHRRRPWPRARSATSTTTPSTSCRPSWTPWASGPGHDQGPRAEPVRRGEHALQRRDPSAPSARQTQFYSMLGSRGIWHDGWKAVTTHPTLSGWSHFNDDTWELYHTDTDRAELHDLAAEHPDKLRELVNLWFAEAGSKRGVPARRPVRAGDHHDPAAAAGLTAQPVRLLPRHRRGTGGPGGRTSATGRTRSARWSISPARAPRACCSRTDPASAGMPCT